MAGMLNTNTVVGLAIGVALGILIADWVKPRLRGALS
jgi:uncharacterized membrane-anchored protein YhcB (DUF1043 family)